MVRILYLSQEEKFNPNPGWGGGGILPLSTPPTPAGFL